MECISHCTSPLGGITVAASQNAVTGLWFDGQKYYAAGLDPENEECTEENILPVFQEVRRWLDQYFRGQEPGFLPPLEPKGTAFQKSVWDILLTIPYGTTITYGQIASRIASEQGLPHMSAQAVGGAVGHNPISILIPCHRVIGSSGSLTGYAGGIDRKVRLLEMEGVDVRKMSVPE
ncbi:MAG: methylated-DNA--[protein]-cysteine S-methyltransferase [Clostridiales bacterium]|nr:methylated-DNA--[protein]-cysteine S-methyltransferase [Clostridiales bacterium]